MEQKIIGPLTFKQFIFVSLGTALSFAAYFLLGSSNMGLTLALIVIIEAIAMFMAFVKIGAVKPGFSSDVRPEKDEASDSGKESE